MRFPPLPSLSSPQRDSQPPLPHPSEQKRNPRPHLPPGQSHLQRRHPGEHQPSFSPHRESRAFSLIQPDMGPQEWSKWYVGLCTGGVVVGITFSAQDHGSGFPLRRERRGWGGAPILTFPGRGKENISDTLAAVCYAIALTTPVTLAAAGIQGPFKSKHGLTDGAPTRSGNPSAPRCPLRPFIESGMPGSRCRSRPTVDCRNTGW